MLRSAAKNYRYVTVIVDPDDYERVISELREQNGATTLQTRFALAKKVFQHTARYDTAISEYLAGLREG
jgi:phosphoribosylaminoimidazolecarboxamide formyltransferase/IMP cyclohydrolase